MNKIWKVLIPFLILLVGFAGTALMVAPGKREKKAAPPPTPLTVKAITMEPVNRPVIVQGTGVVKPARQVSVIPQVGGKIKRIAKGLIPGARFKKGKTLVRLESTEQQLTIEQEKSRLGRAEVELQLEEARQLAAQREWELLGNEGAAPSLAARKPQLEVAKLEVVAAKAGLKRARLNLKRTRIKAPFNAIIRTENVEVGQVVNVGSQIMTLIGDENVHIRISLPASRLVHLNIPGLSEEEPSAAVVTYRPGGGEELSRSATVLRLEGELDPQARTANLLLNVESPFDGQGLPLLPGAYVEAQFQGKNLESAYILPDEALHEAKYVYIASSENKLQRNEVTVAWKYKGEVAVVGGIEKGDRVIVSPVPYPIIGTPLLVDEGQ